MSLAHIPEGCALGHVVLECVGHGTWSVCRTWNAQSFPVPKGQTTQRQDSKACSLVSGYVQGALLYGAGCIMGTRGKM